MAPGGVTYALQESCSALRSYSAGGFHRSSAQFIRQSEHYNTLQHRNTTTNGATQIQVADGAPLPPLPPTAKSAFFLTDGAPLPPLPPTAAVRSAKPRKSVPIWNSRRNLARLFAQRFAGKACFIFSITA